jgi:predicted O-methyltransferase YrrM
MAAKKKGKDARLWDAVDRFLSDKLGTTDAVLEAALQRSEQAGLPPIQVTPNLGRLLQLLAQTQGARRILEVGTLGGYSTIWLARALPPGGCVVSLELERTYAEIAQKNITRAGLQKLVTIKVGDARRLLVEMVANKTKPFDFIFLDADKASYPEYFRSSLQLSRPGTLIVVDNIVRKGAVIDAHDPDANVRGVRQLLDLIAAEPRVNATATQTVGSKGYDGFILARVVGKVGSRRRKQRK